MREGDERRVGRQDRSKEEDDEEQGDGKQEIRKDRSKEEDDEEQGGGKQEMRGAAGSKRRKGRGLSQTGETEAGGGKSECYPDNTNGDPVPLGPRGSPKSRDAPSCAEPAKDG